VRNHRIKFRKRYKSCCWSCSTVEEWKCYALRRPNSWIMTLNCNAWISLKFYFLFMADIILVPNKSTILILMRHTFEAKMIKENNTWMRQKRFNFFENKHKQKLTGIYTKEQKQYLNEQRDSTFLKISSFATCFINWNDLLHYKYLYPSKTNPVASILSLFWKHK
jgi:hypothetical protein